MTLRTYRSKRDFSKTEEPAGKEGTAAAEHAGFEGSIPEGEYGAGTVVVWDRGTFRPQGRESFETMLEKGAAKIELAGEKLAGGFALVRAGFGGKKTAMWTTPR